MAEYFVPPQPLDETVHHVPLRRKRRRKAAVGQLNLTAMIDVIFLLLIFFVVTSNFQLDEGVLAATLPQGTGQPPPTAELPPLRTVITLATVRDDDTRVVIRRGQQAYDGFAALRDDLAALRLDPEAGQHNGLIKPDDPIVIEPGGGVRWQHVVDAFNACLAARYTNVSFAKPGGASGDRGGP